MELDNRAWRKLAMIFIAMALFIPLVTSFAGVSDDYLVNRTTIGVSGGTGTGLYDVRFTTTAYQPGSYPASDNINIGWFDKLEGNHAPNTTKVLINSTYGKNRTIEDIHCFINATDDINATLTAHFNWYNNSVLYTSGRIIITANILSNISTIKSTQTTTGEIWTCEAKTADDLLNETDWNNATIKILAGPVIAPGGSAGPAGGMPGGVTRDKKPACEESWTCMFWSPCVAGERTRICIDYNNCGTEDNKPAETETCEVTIEPEEITPEEPAIEEPKIGVGSAIKTAADTYDKLDKTIDKIIDGISYVIQGIIKVITSIIKTIISLIVSASKTLIAWMTYDNVNFALIIFIYILLILTAILEIKYLLKQYYTEHRSIKLRKKIYTLLQISIISLAAHFALFKQEAYPAYIATITMIIVMALDWYLKTKPARARRKIRIAEKIKLYKEYLKETVKISEKVDRFLIKAPRKPREIEALTREDRYRFTRMKNIIKSIAEKTKKPIEKARKPIKDISKIRPIKVEKLLQKPAQFNEKIREYLAQRQEKQIQKKTEKELAKEHRRLEKEHKRKTKEFRKKLKEAERITRRTKSKLFGAHRDKLSAETERAIKIPIVKIKEALTREEEGAYAKTKQRIQEIIRKTKATTLSELDRKVQKIKQEQEQKRKAREAIENEKRRKEELKRKLKEATRITRETEKRIVLKPLEKIKHALTRKDETKYSKTKQLIQQIISKTKAPTTKELDKKIQQIKQEQEQKRKIRERIKEEKRKAREQKRKEKLKEKQLRKQLKEAEKLVRKAEKKARKPKIKHILTKKDETKYSKTKQLIQQIAGRTKVIKLSELDRKVQQIKQEQEQKRKIREKIKEEKRKLKEQKKEERRKIREEQKAKRKRLREERRIARELRKEAILRQEAKQTEQRRREREIKHRQAEKRRKEREKIEEAKKREAQKQKKQRERLREERRIERELKAEAILREADAQKLKESLARKKAKLLLRKQKEERTRQREIKHRQAEIRRIEREQRKAERKREEAKQRKQIKRLKEERKIERELKRETKRKQKEAKIKAKARQRKQEKIRKQHSREIKKLLKFNKDMKTYLKEPKKKIKKKKHKTRFEILAEKVRALEDD